MEWSCLSPCFQRVRVKFDQVDLIGAGQNIVIVVNEETVTIDQEARVIVSRITPVDSVGQRHDRARDDRPIVIQRTQSNAPLHGTSTARVDAISHEQSVTEAGERRVVDA